MKFAVIGCGSIGRRHIRNLIELGHEVIAWNRGHLRRNEIKKMYNISVYDNLNEMLAIDDVVAVLVCSPNSFHLEHANLALDYGKHLFVEKPLANDLDGVWDLKDKAEFKNLITHVGCNMRYHFGPKSIKEYLDGGEIGKPLWASLWGGMHLPDWHPEEDHREMYSAKKELGGGAVLDFIHELDLSNWLFGTPVTLTSMITNSQSLAIETEDIVDVILNYKSGLQVNIHLDYLQRPFQRGIRIVGDKGWINWDINLKHVEIFDHNTSKSHLIGAPKEWQHNDMYITQMKYFINCIAEGVHSNSCLTSGINALDIAVRIKESSKSNLVETIC